MQFTHIVAALGLASLAVARPGPQNANDDTPQKFAVSDFIFGCTGGCDYNFNVGVYDRTPAVYCNGSLTQTDYIPCDTTGLKPTESISAYIDVKEQTKRDYIKIKYSTSPAPGTTLNYFGETEVYSQTGDNRNLQPKAFDVAVTSSTSVA